MWGAGTAVGCCGLAGGPCPARSVLSAGTPAGPGPARAAVAPRQDRRRAVGSGHARPASGTAVPGTQVSRVLEGGPRPLADRWTDPSSAPSVPVPPTPGPIPQTGDERSARLSEGREQEEGRGRASHEAPGPLAWRPQWPQALSVVLEGPSRRARCRAAWPQAPGCGGSRQRRPRAGRPLPPRHPPSPCGPRVESHQSARLNLHLILKEFVFPDSVHVCFNPPKGELRLINKRRLKMVEKNVFPSPWERNAT